MTLVYDAETRTLAAGVTRSEADEAEAAKAIFEYLATQPEAVEETVIHAAVEARRVVKQKSLRKLVSEGKVTRTGTGKKGDKFHYQNAGTQVPGMCGVPENLGSKARVSESAETSNVGTGLFDDSHNIADSPVPALLTKNEELL